jgi:hypothetical protein
MGRVIRHRWDYGAVLLADERFGSQQNLRNMSRWLRDQVVHHNSFGAAIASLTKFFKVWSCSCCSFCAAHEQAHTGADGIVCVAMRPIYGCNIA